MTSQFFYRTVFFVQILLLVSCATMNKPAEVEEPLFEIPFNWAEEEDRRKTIKHWEVRGRLGIQSEYNGGSLDIIWKQAGDDFTMRLIAPLGAGTYLIQGDNAYAEIRFPDGKKTIINSLDDVFASAFDIDLPASALIDWVRGVPASALTLESISWNEQGLMKQVEQSGWRVNMSKYAGNKINMPHAIYLSRDDNEDLDIRFLFRQWMLDD